MLEFNHDADGSPGHVALTGVGVASITGGGTGVDYQPGAGYYNSIGDQPADEFSYTLNGGSTATVAVTVTCPSATGGLTTLLTALQRLLQQILATWAGWEGTD